MSKTSRFAEIDQQLSVKIVPCGLCRFLEGLPTEDADYLIGMLRQPVADKGHAHIVHVIAAGGGPKFDDKTISRHRERHLGQ